MWNQIPDNQLAPELDDGEMWLPSDIFLNEFGTSARLNPRRTEDHRLFPCMDVDSLSRQFPSLSLLRQASLKPKIPLHFERFNPQVLRRSGSPVPGHALRLSHGGFEAGQRLHDCGGTRLTRVAEEFYDSHLPKPVQTEVEAYLHLARIRALQRERNRLQTHAPPFYRNAGVLVSTSVPGASSGTGVFHPRNTSYPATNNSTTKVASVKRHAKKGQRPEFDATQQRSSERKMVGPILGEDCYYHLPRDIGITRNWTC